MAQDITNKLFDILEKDTVLECINAIRGANINFAGTTYDRNTCKAALEAAIRSIRERFPNA